MMLEGFELYTKWRMAIFIKGILSTAIILSTVAGTTNAELMGYTVQSNGDDNLYRIDLTTGAYTRIGPVGYDDVEGLGFDLDGTLYGISGVHDEVITIDITTGAGTLVGRTDLAGIDSGAAICPDTGRLYNISGRWPINSWLYEINKTAGTSLELATYELFADGMAIGPGRVAFVTDTVFSHSLYRIDLDAPSTITEVGHMDVGSGQSGLARSPLTDSYYMLLDNGGLFSVNTATGHASLIAHTVDSCEGFAIIPEPATLLLLGLGGLMLRKRSQA